MRWALASFYFLLFPAPVCFSPNARYVLYLAGEEIREKRDPPSLVFFSVVNRTSRLAYLAPPFLLLLLFFRLSLDSWRESSMCLVPFRRQIVSIRPC